MNDLQASIKRNWFPPGGQEHHATLAFKVSEDGYPSEINFIRHAPTPLADQAALNALKARLL